MHAQDECMAHGLQLQLQLQAATSLEDLKPLPQNTHGWMPRPRPVRWATRLGAPGPPRGPQKMVRPPGLRSSSSSKACTVGVWCVGGQGQAEGRLLRGAM